MVIANLKTSTMVILTANSDAPTGDCNNKTPPIGGGLFKAIGNKLIKTPKRQKRCQNDSRSSSSESSRSRAERSMSPNQISSSSSDTGSDVQTTEQIRHHHSTSAESLLKAFQNFNPFRRSRSCTTAKETMAKSQKKSKKEEKVQKCILRPAPNYTYVKGLSGLPTRRVPRSSVRRYSTCGCSMHYLNSLNR